MIEGLVRTEYKYGFVTDVEADAAPPGLNEEIIRFISAKKQEPELAVGMAAESVSALDHDERAALAAREVSADRLSGHACITRRRSGRPTVRRASRRSIRSCWRPTRSWAFRLRERERLAGVAVDAVFDSVSVATTFKETLAAKGVIFLFVQRGGAEASGPGAEVSGDRWCRIRTTFYAALNSAVFSDGSFCFIPKGVRCPMELSTYFRINAANTGQFERTLIVAEEGAHVSYLEGCTAPMRDENQLHAAVVELIALDQAEIKYSTVQNWYPGDAEGRGGIYNFVTKRGLCRGRQSKISWTQVETGSAITWKYPSVVLQGENSVGEFYSVALTNNRQQADTGTKMVHIGKNTRSTIISKGISAGNGQNSYRGLVKIQKSATNARNFSQCDSLLIGDKCGAHTFPYIEVKNTTASVEHEATTSKIGEDQIFYCNSAGSRRRTP